MQISNTAWCGALAVAILSSACGGAQHAASTEHAASKPSNHFNDPLQTSAERISGAASLARQPIVCLTNAGERLIGAGLRGLIVISDDGGAHWRQAKVPVRSDLLALSFPTPQQGWAVGHDGVILHSDDAGESWSKQLDGVDAASLFTAYYQQRIDAGEAELQPFLDQVVLNTSAGPVLPYLSVYFENEKTGYATGSFGMLLATQDGGVSWQPALDRIDNKDFLNLNDIRRVGDNVYIAGERGSVFRLDPARSRFVAVPTPYEGSFFGVTGTQDYVLVYGLGGNAYRSTDRGASWQPAETQINASLTAAAADDGALILVSARGQVLVSRDQGQHFSTLKIESPMLYSAVAAVGEHHLVLGGFQGVQQQALQASAVASLEGRR